MNVGRAAHVVREALEASKWATVTPDDVCAELAAQSEQFRRLRKAGQLMLARNVVTMVRETAPKELVPDDPKPSLQQIAPPGSPDIHAGNALTDSLRKPPPPASGGPKAKRRRFPSQDEPGGSPSPPVSFLAKRPSIRYSDVGGMDTMLTDIRELVEWPLFNAHVYHHLGVAPPRGVLLHGPPGCGKTLLIDAIAGETNVPLFRISAPEIVAGVSGESEQRVRALFAEAKASAPCLVVIDAIDVIAARRENASKDMERRILAQLLSSMDDISSSVVVIAETSRPEVLDPSIRRAGRFDREMEIHAPDVVARRQILVSMTAKMHIGPVDWDFIASKTVGYVGADLQALISAAATTTLRRAVAMLPPIEAEQPLVMSSEQTALLQITMDDLAYAMSKTQPSALREGFAMIPDVSWSDIGALEEVREELTLTVIEPIQRPERFTALGVNIPAGVLLYGPPGCGKTLLAKAVAKESGANFISVKGPELLDKWVGESERAVRRLFQRARASSPCVIFFDELDALAPRRSSGRGDSDGATSERVVNQLLTELDGVDGRRSVFVIAATNRPDIIDPAMLRPGRLDKLLYVGMPSEAGRESILRTALRAMPVEEDFDVGKIALDCRCEGFTGADLVALTREAAMNVLRSSSPDSTRLVVKYSDFTKAFGKVFPSVSTRDARLYRDLRGRLRRSRGHLSNNNPVKQPEIEDTECGSGGEGK